MIFGIVIRDFPEARFYIEINKYEVVISCSLF